MNKGKITSVLMGSLKNKMLVSILAVSLISAGGIILSSQNNLLSNNSINNKTILAQKETTKDTTKAVTKSNEDTTKTPTSMAKAQEQTSTSTNNKVVSNVISKQVQSTTSKADVQNSVSSTQSSEATNSQISTMKENYLNELGAINEKANNLINGNANDTQYKIDESSVQVYNLWNDELNKIYSSLKSTLTTEEMAKLQSEEINWISYKEQVAKEDSTGYEDGSLYSSVVNLKLANLTKERCYYLVNNYM